MGLTHSPFPILQSWARCVCQPQAAALQRADWPCPSCSTSAFRRLQVTVQKRNVLRSTGASPLLRPERKVTPSRPPPACVNHHKSKQEFPSTEGCSQKSASTTPPSRVTQRAQPCRALTTHLLLVPLPPADIPGGLHRTPAGPSDTPRDGRMGATAQSLSPPQRRSPGVSAEPLSSRVGPYKIRLFRAALPGEVYNPNNLSHGVTPDSPSGQSQGWLGPSKGSLAKSPSSLSAAICVTAAPRGTWISLKVKTQWKCPEVPQQTSSISLASRNIASQVANLLKLNGLPGARGGWGQGDWMEPGLSPLPGPSVLFLSLPPSFPPPSIPPSLPSYLSFLPSFLFF